MQHNPIGQKARWVLPGEGYHWAKTFVAFSLLTNLLGGGLFLGFGVDIGFAQTLPDEEVIIPDEEELIYTWERIYYGRLEGEQRLLYTRPFSRSQASFADVDGDNKDDLLIGKSDGRLALFINTGKPGEPKFVLQTEDLKAYHLESTGGNNTERVETIIDVGENAAPTVVDIDADGDLDLFIGSKDGTIFHYNNIGNALLPIFELATPSYMGLRPGTNTVPRFKDVNTDRAPDLLIGTHVGKVYLYLNAGVPVRAKFCTETEEIDTTALTRNRCFYPRQLISDIAPEVDASPAWVDWNYDGLWDVAVGKASGQISFYYNNGSSFAPKWKMESDRFLFIDAGGYASPVFYDLNQDGFDELLVGSSTSQMIYYENREVLQTQLPRIQNVDLSEINWKDDHLLILQNVCNQLDGAPACLPALGRAFNIPNDVNQDLQTYADYIVRPRGVIAAQEEAPVEGAPDPAQDPANAADPAADPANANQGAFQWNPNPRALPAQVAAPDAAAPDPLAPAGEEAPSDTAETAEDENFSRTMAYRNNLWLSTRNFLEFGHFLSGDRNTTVTSGDWDNDGDLDLMLGGRSGKLYAYENIGTGRSPNWRAMQAPLFNPNQRADTAPVLVDIDGDNDLDIVVGKRNGRLELITNIGTQNRPNWEITELSFGEVDAGNNSIPNFVDIDKDDDLDLFVGNSKGRIIFYENSGSKTEPRFELKSTRFAYTLEDRNLAPMFFAWNHDDQPDLILGSRDGLLKVISSDIDPNLPITRGWQLKTIRWAGIETVGFSTPHPADFDGDQQIDLLVGDVEGNIMIWLNRGFIEREDLEDEEEFVNNSVEQTDTDDPFAEEPEIVEVDAFPAIEEEALLPEIPLDLPFDPVYVLVTDKYGQIDVGQRAVPAFFDFDVDGDLDMIIGNKQGELIQFLNEGSPSQPRWVKVTNRFLEYNGGRNATPVFVDLEQDGDLDLVVGNERGTITYWENKGSFDFPEFVANNEAFRGITGGLNSRPAFFDINQDGLLDLIIGNFKGQLQEFIQRPGANNSFYFELVHRKYLDLDVGIGATPTIADLNNDDQVELIIGSDRGPVENFQQVPIDPNSPWGWQSNNTWFTNLEFPVGSFPVFSDLDADDDVDMIIGSESGKLYFFRNDGQPTQEVSQQ